MRGAVVGDVQAGQLAREICIITLSPLSKQGEPVTIKCRIGEPLKCIKLSRRGKTTMLVLVSGCSRYVVISDR